MDNNITISVMTEEKEINILKDKQSFGYTYDDTTMTSLKEHFKLKDSLYLISKKEEKEFAAFCSIDRDWWEENFFFIREILVEPDFQKMGIGKELVTRCIEHAREKEATGVVTETAFENYPMQKLCEKLGFKKWDNPQWKTGITYKLLLPHV